MSFVILQNMYRGQIIIIEQSYLHRYSSKSNAIFHYGVKRKSARFCAGLLCRIVSYIEFAYSTNVSAKPFLFALPVRPMRWT